MGKDINIEPVAKPLLRPVGRILLLIPLLGGLVFGYLMCDAGFRLPEHYGVAFALHLFIKSSMALAAVCAIAGAMLIFFNSPHGIYLLLFGSLQAFICFSIVIVNDLMGAPMYVDPSKVYLTFILLISGAAVPLIQSVYLMIKDLRVRGTSARRLFTLVMIGAWSIGAIAMNVFAAYYGYSI